MDGLGDGVITNFGYIGAFDPDELDIGQPNNGDSESKSVIGTEPCLLEKRLPETKTVRFAR